ncbi:p-aminobenzoyl-glutamate transporter [Falsiroseomonas bella]|uniref:p-aminobenzoyl-glutamate transporter n=1 Tax=Falsiroseomonas bella TaxID=2184016 RepID=A0A317FAR9_9PROT|nr:AbgT family transporter [Falsiroseomonas bella]PWS35009.1 p-aminobenzoyl-glutamate transporter [Falsiroseomonas bella]
MSEAAAPKGGMQKLLDWVERVGNRVPHPVMIFVYLIAIVIVLSTILSVFGARVSYQAYNPATGDIEPAFTEARSLLTIEGIRFMFTGVVGNFMGFNAVGVIIVAMVGVGVAEESGLVKALIRKLVIVAPAKALTYILTFVGIVSSIAADAGYLVLIPLAAAAFISVGRHPLAGLAVGFASVAAAFLVNVLITPVDGILTEITNDAIRLVNPNLSIDLAANVWFSMGSVALLTVLIALITERIIEPRLGPYTGDYKVPGETVLSEAEYRGLRMAGLGLLGVLAFLALLTLPPGAPLRHPQTGAIIGSSPFMNSLIVSISLIFLVCGIAYGRGAGTMRTTNDVIAAIQKAIGGLAGLILLLLVISQFIAFFNYTNMATLAAVSMAAVLEALALPSIALLLGFVVVVFLLDLIITAAIAKWAIFAPVFVPLLMQLGVEPEAVLAAYRVGDSPMNAITPLNAYFAMIVTFAIKYQKEAGVGTVIALMLPYVIWLSVIWTAFLAGWYLLGLPWGL